MTEAEWNACTDPLRMLRHVPSNTSYRKLRLLSVACCRRIWPSLLDARGRRAVEIAEQYADSRATEEERSRAEKAMAYVAGATYAEVRNRSLGDDRPFISAVMAASLAVDPDHGITPFPGLLMSILGYAIQAAPDPAAEQAAQAALLRDLFGTPCRLKDIDLACLTPTVLSLAEAIYEERAFDRLPILADALEDAGCDNPENLKHCRSGQEHVRGCWVVDLVLGKE